MAKRYSKHYSNFILKKKYQYSTKGTIWERDWVTIGAQHQIEKGKRPFYGDSGFLFTDNSIPDTHKRHDFGKIVGEWTYDDVYSSTPIVNEVKLNYDSNDLRDFAYYGSCSELIRTSIENILTWFPGCMIKDEKCYKVTKLDDKNYKFELQQNCNGSNIEYIFSNPFQFDLITENINNREIKNIRRYVSKTWADFDVILGDNYKTPLHVINYSVKKEGAIDTCLSIQKIAEITITYKDGDDEKTLIINAYLCNGDVVYTTKGKEVSEIRLSEDLIEQYFYDIDGFERLLLRRDTKPLYSNTFLKMFETDNGIRYAYRDYAWPTVNDYCIDIESPVYAAFVQSLNETATEFDNMWTDNMWRNMTHEAIKNYDWTYTKEYSTDDEQDFVDGGSRMEKLIRVYGRVFDDIKRYIDGIRFTSKLSYDGYNNMPDAEISDKLDYNGWDIYSTIPYFPEEDESGNVNGDDLSTVYISDDALDSFGIKWFLSKNNNEVTAAESDISFLRRLALSSKYLIKSKGTLKGIDMIMALFGLGPNDYSIEEQYYTVKMKNYSEGVEKNIADMVHYDNVSWFYDDPYEGVPFGNVELYNKKFIIPYYDHSKKYLGDLAFQSNGGWAKKSLDTDEPNDYEETLSYLNVVPNFNSLLEVNTYALGEGDENIYYVIDVSDYINSNENAPYNITHYFYCNDIYNPELTTSWSPILKYYIDMDDIVDQRGYDNLGYRLNADINLGDYVQDIPNEISQETYNAYQNGICIYVCGGKIAYKDDNCNVLPSNPGYVSAANECVWYEQPTYISMIKFNDPNLAELNHINKGKYDSLGYVNGNSLTFDYNSDGISLNQWIDLSDTEKGKCLIMESEFYNLYSERSGTPDETHDFDLKQIYYDCEKLTDEDYSPLSERYTSLKDDYILVDEENGIYARKYEGNDGLYARAEYLDSIISSSIGNNPHVGYGRYDLGNEYFEYMQRPFKYYTDKYNLPQDVYGQINSEKYQFTLSDYPYSAIRWGVLTSKIRLPYLIKMGWDETENETIDEETGSTTTNYTYKKDGTDNGIVYDAKVKDVTDTYVYSDGYTKTFQSEERHIDWEIAYTEIKTDDGYLYDKYLTEEQYSMLSEADMEKWIINDDGITYHLKDAIRSTIRRSDLLVPWNVYVYGDNWLYWRNLTDEQYNDMINSGASGEEIKEWVKAIITSYSYDKYTDVEDEIINTPTPNYYLNTKMFIMRISHNNEYFKRYFLDVIGKYVVQMIPSTAITVFLFEDDNNENGGN